MEIETGLINYTGIFQDRVVTLKDELSDYYNVPNWKYGRGFTSWIYQDIRAHPEKYNYKSSYYTFILYPDNDNNMLLLKYLYLSGHYDYVFIRHSPDDNFQLDFTELSDYTNQQSYKDHYHIIVKYSRSCFFSTFVNQFCWYDLHLIQSVGNPDELIRYFLHHDLKSVSAGKPYYQWSDLTYTEAFNNLIQRLMIKESSKGFRNPRLTLMDYLQVAKSWNDFMYFALSSDDEIVKCFRQCSTAFFNAYKELHKKGEFRYD